MRFQTHRAKEKEQFQSSLLKKQEELQRAIHETPSTNVMTLRELRVRLGVVEKMIRKSWR